MKLANNKILITGGASGIGLGLTERFYKEGNQVIICGRRANVLDDVATQFPGTISKVCDLEHESERIALYDWVRENHPDLNVLINNAGIQQWMKVDDADFYSRSVQEVTTNILAPLHLTNLFLKLPSLTTIVNVTSGLSFVPFTKVPVYSATKAFFHSFTLSLQHLLKEKNIEVMEIVPPALNTDLGGKGLHDSAPPVSAFIDSIFEQLKAGKTTLTFGFTEAMVNVGREELKGAFERINSH